jgi:hypothetical protein
MSNEQVWLVLVVCAAGLLGAMHARRRSLDEGSRSQQVSYLVWASLLVVGSVVLLWRL